MIDPAAPAEPAAIALPWPRRASKLQPTLQKLSACFNMSEAQSSTFTQLYAATVPTVPTVQVGQPDTTTTQNLRLHDTLHNAPERGVAVWGFVQDRALRNELLLLLYHTFSPKVAFAADTRKSFFECLLVINLDALKDAAGKAVTAAQIETWLDVFLDCLGISAGVVVFDKYMDDSMVTCIDRIETASMKDGCFGTLFHAHNHDFYRLYLLSKNMMHARADAHLHTGMELDSATLVRLYQQQAVMQRELSVLLEREQHTAEARMRERELVRQTRRGSLEVAHILVNMHRTGTISQDMRDHMLSLLGLAATSVSTANLENLFTRTDGTSTNASHTVHAVFPYNDTVTLLRAIPTIHSDIITDEVDMSIHNGRSAPQTAAPHTDWVPELENAGDPWRWSFTQSF